MIRRVARVVVAAATLLGAATPSSAQRSDPAPTAEHVTAARPERPERPERIEQARQQTLDASYQAALPRERPGSRGDTSDDPAAVPRRKPGGELDGAMVDARAHQQPAALSLVMRVVMWGLVIVVGVLVVSWLASELLRYGGDAELAPAAASRDRLDAAADAIIDRPLEDADELARRGRHVEAIHTLLLRTLAELVHSAAVRVAPAMTSREILARVPLQDAARSALAGLITAVEVTHFGDEPASAADYERCRRQFHVFAEAFRGRRVAVAA